MDGHDIRSFSRHPLCELASPLPKAEHVTCPLHPIAQLRSVVAVDHCLEKKRKAIVLHMHQIFPSRLRLPHYNLNAECQGMVQDILYRLDQALMGIRYHTSTGKVGYYIDSSCYTQLMDQLSMLQDRGLPTLKVKGEWVRPLPRWGYFNRIHQVWSSSDFTFLAILLRDEVENLLGYLYDQRALFSRTVRTGRTSFGTTHNSTALVSKIQVQHSLSSKEHSVHQDVHNASVSHGHSPSGTRQTPHPITAKSQVIVAEPQEPLKASTPVLLETASSPSIDVSIRAIPDTLPVHEGIKVQCCTPLSPVPLTHEDIGKRQILHE
jgi:hypothetical protein